MSEHVSRFAPVGQRRATRSSGPSFCKTGGMTTRAEALGRTLISRNTPQASSNGAAPIHSAVSIVGKHRDLGTKLLLASILCSIVAFAVAAVFDIGLAVGGLGVAGVLFYAGHWLVS